MFALFDLTAKASALLLLAAVTAGAMRRASAASRHLLWMGIFAALLVLPLARLELPAIRVPVLEPEPTVANVLVGPVVAHAAPTSVAPTPLASVGPAVEAIPHPTGVSSTQPPTRGWRASDLVLATWASVAGLFVLRLLLGLLWTRRLGRQAQAVVDPAIVGRLNRIRASLRVRRSIRLLVSPSHPMPVTWGLARPVILVPPGLLDRPRTRLDELEAVLTHEVAHVARWDTLSQAIVRLGVAMFWFNPLAWMAARASRLERERACDDIVLRLGTKASDYATHLVDIAWSGPRLVAPLAMARPSDLERRIRAILDDRLNRRGVSQMSVALTAVLLVFGLPLSAVSLTARAGEPGHTAVLSDVVLPMPIEAPLSVPPSVVRRAAVLPVTPSTPEVVPEPIAAVVPEQQPTSAPPPPSAQVPFSVDALSSSNWHDGRAALLGQLLDRAQQFHRDSLRMVEIGTMASVETLTAETVIVNLKAAIEFANNKVGPVPPDAEIALTRRVYTVALQNLNAEILRFNAGFTTNRNVAQAFLYASGVLIHATLTDADLVAALRGLATTDGPTDRANTLVWIAEAYALTPEMVTLYATAASSIPSAAERERVFAHPIRIKPSETGQ